MTLVAVLGAALPAMAQDSDLRKEVEQLKEKVKSLESAKAAPAPEKDLLDVSDTTVLDILMREVKIGGFIDTGYIFNMNRPKTGTGDKGTNAVHIFTNDPSTFYLHNAQLEFMRAPTKEVIVGYDVRLMVGSDADGVDVATDDNFGLQQANIQILMPVGDGIMWKIGKFATLAGAEVIESKDNYNYTRSLNFNWAIPFTHTGIRGTYNLEGGKFGFTLGLNNGWDNQIDDNFGKTLEAQVAFTPIEWFSAYLNFYFGDEASGATSDENEKRTLIDIVVTVQKIPGLEKLTAQLNIDIGKQDESSAVTAGDDAEWTGFSLAGRYQINDIWAGAIRFSMLDDEEEFRLGGLAGGAGIDGVKYTEITFTVEARPVKDLIVRAEVRFDMADEDVFLDGKDVDDAQTIFGLEAILIY
ncbi:MAG TPA: porin [Planctomycetota bacterium]